MPEVYATRSDVFKYATNRANLASPGRVVASVDVATNSIELDSHGFEDNDRVTFDPCEGGSLPAPLTAETQYFVKRANQSRFRVSLTSGGADVDLTSIGAGGFAVAIELPFDAVLEYCSRWVDTLIPAHAVPLVAPYPNVVTVTVAELAARKLMHLAGHRSESVDEYEALARERLKDWARGIRIADPIVRDNVQTNLAVKGRSSATQLSARGWGTGI